MRNILVMAALATLVIALSAPHAAAIAAPSYGMGFQWLRDDDGDGIPNHFDDDWVPPLDGTGYQMKHGGTVAVMGFCPSSRSAQGDRVYDRTQDQDRLRDGTYDRIRLRLKDGSCQ